MSDKSSTPTPTPTIVEGVVSLDVINMPPQASLMTFQYGRVICRREMDNPQRFYINTRADGVTEIRQARNIQGCAEQKQGHDVIEIAFNPSNFWLSLILAGPSIGIIRATTVKTFMRPYGLGGERDVIMRVGKKDYIWRFNEARDKYALTEGVTEKKICSLSPNYNSVHDRIESATLVFDKWEHDYKLAPACIVAAIVFFNAYGGPGQV